MTQTEWLVSSLLKMAKLETRTIEFTRENVLSSKIIHIALEPLQILLDVKNQRISCDDEELSVLCDRRWTGEALTNIIKNASEYSPEGGSIIIKTGSNPICSWISVTDSGNGVPASDIPRLFQRFKGSRSEKGYGIGLPLSLAIVQGQNSDLEKVTLSSRLLTECHFL